MSDDVLNEILDMIGDSSFIGLELEIQEILQSLLKRNQYIRFALLSSVEGMPIAYASSKWGFDDAEVNIAAASAVLLATSFKTATMYGLGDLDGLIMEAQNGRVFILPIDDSKLLTVFFSKNAPLNILKRDLDYTKRKIKEVIR